MITIDPYEMKLRFTYDIQKWMSINDTLTAAFYDYRKNVYHLFFDNNRYYTWTVNVSYMNSLPMSWVCVCLCVIEFDYLLFNFI
mgnify:CR=1 FL=1